MTQNIIKFDKSIIWNNVGWQPMFHLDGTIKRVLVKS